ncbi:MAG TPA: patatin-like phospholipase family protein [Fimbriiglobus sp.]|jgi:predicted patatin/cPLA2 family phospholipase|nr:patatin-like phospholipase family protein [Fimbriiglobus sp.]
MVRPASRWLVCAGLFGIAVVMLAGCGKIRDPYRGTTSPVEAGLNTNDLIDPAAQIEADSLGNVQELYAAAERLKAGASPNHRPTAADPSRPRRSVLCISGGGALGAYPAGVVCGWTAHGDRPGCNGRPNFDVVTGISTGALIAPLVFLGPQYDEEVRKFYTTVEKRDIFRLRPVRGLFSIALADNAPLAGLVDEVLTEDKVQELAAEHRKGRRLYIGTTELEGRRFVFWDLGAIACRGCPDDREMIKKILLGSSAIPGFFPPARIPVTVDGKTYVEEHGDGGVSMGIFFRPPYIPPERWTPEGKDLHDVDLYMLVAGKLYSDAAPIKERSLTLAGSSVSTIIYGQTRGDLQRMYLISILSGMSYNLAAIPPEFPAPMSSTEFSRGPMTAMFDEGYRQAAAGTAWRKSPPGVEPGESMLGRAGTVLTEQPRGSSSGMVWDKKDSPIRFPAPGVGIAPGAMPIPVSPGTPIAR